MTTDVIRELLDNQMFDSADSLIDIRSTSRYFAFKKDLLIKQCC